MYQLRWVVLKGGERRPLLVDPQGIPDWWSTEYVSFRIRKKSASTVEKVLYAINAVYQWAASKTPTYDLSAKLRSGEGLSGRDIDSLEAWLTTSKKLRAQQKKVVSIRRALNGPRAEIADALPSLGPNSTYVRLTYAGNFLKWMSKRLRPDLGAESRAHASAEELLERRGGGRGRGSRLDPPEGLSGDVQDRLWAITKPGNSENPWDQQVQARNYLIVRLLVLTGIRRGELLGITVPDVCFRANVLTIRRRHDDPNDPRRRQPVAKTLGRGLPLDQELPELLTDYLQERWAVPGAKRHPYLFVVHKKGPHQGRPMSGHMLWKIFRDVQAVAPVEFERLFPHLMRHTWNGNFSGQMDEEKVPRAVEEKLRSRLAGWQEGSGTARLYTRREIRQKSEAAFLRHQEKMRRKV